MLGFLRFGVGLSAGDRPASGLDQNVKVRRTQSGKNQSNDNCKGVIFHSVSPLLCACRDIRSAHELNCTEIDATMQALSATFFDIT
jgi:hypothetical protein